MTTLSIPFILSLFAAAAQEPPPGIGSAGSPGGGQKEMLELFAKVERRLKEIDKLLFDASAGDVPTAPVADAGIDKLLEGAIQRGQEAQQGIDRILELARSMQPSGGGSGQPQEQKPGESPLDQQRNQDGGQREQTPQQPEGSDPRQTQPDPADPQPGPDPETDPGNRVAQDPPAARTERVGAPDSADSWGTLPIHVREIFRAEGADDLPPQYRDWIDGYYRRLQRIDRR